MIKIFKNNPLLVHQIRNARWPSPRTAVLIAVGLTVVGMAWILFPYLLPSNAIEPESFGLVPIVLVGLALLALPLLTAIVAVVTTVRAVNSEAYRMMSLSQLSGRDIVTGYAAGTLFRLRGLWAFTVGLAIPQIAAWTFPDLHLIINACFRGLSPYCSEHVLDIGFPLTVVIFYWTFFPTLTWAAANLGVWMALRLRRMSLALVGTLVPIGIIIVIYNPLLNYLINLDMELLLRLQPVMPFVFGGPTIILGWLAYRLAVKCAGRRRE